MSSKNSEQPNRPESHPSGSPYATYNAILFTALVAAIIGILIVLVVMFRILHTDLSSINSELDSLNLRITNDRVVTVVPESFATFTVRSS